jgi:hypothetical protein
MKRMQGIKAIGMNKQGVRVGKREIHVESMLRESLIKNLSKI